MLGMAYQFEENSAGSGIHLELVSDMRGTFVGDQCRIEINIFGDTAEVIFGSCLYIPADT